MTHRDKAQGDKALKMIFTTMWTNWALTFGALVLPIVAALLLRRIFIPVVILAEIYLLTAYVRSRRGSAVGSCALVTSTSVRVLVPSMLVMLGIALLCTDWLIPKVVHLRLYNQEIPYITSLVIFPIAALVCCLSLLMGMWDKRFRECRRINNLYAGDSFIGTFYYREARYQAIMLLILSVVLGAVEYWYYFTRYINSNFNAPDRFFFTFMPVAVYVVSLVVMASRYANMYATFRAVDADRPDRAGTTRLRFLVFFDNDLLLSMGRAGRWDTPVETSIPSRPAVSPEEALLYFTELTGLEKCRLRYCYTTNDELVPNANIVHYAAFVDDEGSVHVGSPDDRWFNAYMLDCAMQSGTLADVLVNELFRIHTITMAWKTYDRSGRRLYPIRHYRPTFRFGDMPDWEVDYDDTSWLAVADNNEDRRLYRLYSLWNRLTGIFSRNGGRD